MGLLFLARPGAPPSELALRATATTIDAAAEDAAASDVYVALNGSDTADGRTAATALRSLAAARNAARTRVPHVFVAFLRWPPCIGLPM